MGTIVKIRVGVLEPASQAGEELLFLFFTLLSYVFQILGSHRNTSIVLGWWTANAFNVGLRASVLACIQGAVSPMSGFLEISFL